MWIKTGYKDYERTTGYRKKKNKQTNKKPKKDQSIEILQV